ncbi:MAG: Holliday junction resolvase RuvX [Armatimonadetes bacterium]|nr:Holliday junction resolvase RuvX [Armatimonadota bacterium]
MRIMALDIGAQRVGVALSDPLEMIASPYQVLARTPDDEKLAEAVLEVVRAQEVGEIVVGMPTMLSGSAGIQAEKAQAVVALLRSKTDISVVTWDERLTTVQVERLLLEADISRTRRKRVVDKMAAAVILQNYLDWKSARKSST